VDMRDFAKFQACLTSDGDAQNDPTCAPGLLDLDNDVDQFDLALFKGCMSGPNVPGDPACLN